MSGYADAVGQELANDLASMLGIATPPDAWRAFAAQAANETANGDPATRGVRNNNPFNLRPYGSNVYPGQIGVDNDPGGPFAIFATRSAGVRAAATNYTNANYQIVQDALRKGGDPGMVAEAIQISPWDAGHYGGRLTSSLGNAQTVSTSADMTASDLSAEPLDKYGLTQIEATISGAPADSIWNQIKGATGGQGTPLSTVPVYVAKTVASKALSPIVLAAIVGVIVVLVVLGD